MYKPEPIPLHSAERVAGSRAYQIIKIIAANVIVTAALLGFIEIAVRIFYPEIKPMGTDRSLMAPNVYGNSSAPKPNAVGMSCGVEFRVDQYGFWGYRAAFDSTKPSWLWLGDSVTMGMGVEPDSTFAGRGAAAIDSYNILNAALVSYTSTDYRHVAEAWLNEDPANGKSSLHLKRVTLFWCLNDVYSDLEVLGSPGKTVRQISGGLLKFLKLHYNTYQWLKASFFDRGRSHYLYDRGFYRNDGAHLQASLRDLKQIIAFARKNTVRFEIVLLPYEYQLRPANADWLPQQLMQTALRDVNIPVYDAAESLRDFSEPAELYRYGDGIHFSQRGHTALAQYLVKTLPK